MKLANIIEGLETLAPLKLAQDWDNVGLLVGDSSADVSKVMLCVDLTREVLSETIRTKASLVVSYHPIIFKHISRVTAQDAPIVYEAARRGIAVYSMHTAFDVVPGGTNNVLAEAMGVVGARPIEPTVGHQQCKIVSFVPLDDMAEVAHAACEAGAGRIGEYYDCAFFCHGVGAFCGGPSTHPSVGRPGRHESTEEMRLEVTAPKADAARVCEAIRKTHSYETPIIDVYPLENCAEGCGMGRVGKLAKPVSIRTLINRIKKATGLKKVLVADVDGSGDGAKRMRLVTTAACGAGSCGSLFKSAVSAGATFYLTGEMRHHDLLAATAAGLTVVCLGHSNSERIAIGSLAERLREMLAKVKVEVSKHDEDPLVVV